MLFEEAVIAAKKGERVTRPAFGERFVVVRDGRVLRGAFIGETGLARMAAYAFTEEDLRASDWVPFRRILPDDWVGCDAG